MAMERDDSAAYVCPSCHGRKEFGDSAGIEHHGDWCTTCDGTGYVSREKLEEHRAFERELEDRRRW